MKVYCFGDSWAYGSELDFSTESPFVKHFSDAIQLDYENHGIEGASLGVVLEKITKISEKFTPGDIALVIIPPDVRWYSESKETGFYTINIETKEYKDFLQNKSENWFIYHHAIFIFAMQKIFDASEVQYLMAFNYGSPESLYKTNLPINKQVFISEQDLLSTLAGKPKNQGRSWLGYRFDEDGPSEFNFTGKYFLGKKQHPNDLGHQTIAKLFLDSYNLLYKQKGYYELR